MIRFVAAERHLCDVVNFFPNKYEQYEQRFLL